MKFSKITARWKMSVVRTWKKIKSLWEKFWIIYDRKTLRQIFHPLMTLTVKWNISWKLFKTGKEQKQLVEFSQSSYSAFPTQVWFIINLQKHFIPNFSEFLTLWWIAFWTSSRYRRYSSWCTIHVCQQSHPTEGNSWISFSVLHIFITKVFRQWNFNLCIKVLHNYVQLMYSWMLSEINFRWKFVIHIESSKVKINSSRWWKFKS